MLLSKLEMLHFHSFCQRTLLCSSYVILVVYICVIPSHLRYYIYIYSLISTDIIDSVWWLSVSCLYNYQASTHTLAYWVECLPMAHETGVQFQVESYQRLKKWYLMPLCFALSTIRWGSRVKWSNPVNGVVPSPTHRCSSYWLGMLLANLFLKF